MILTIRTDFGDYRTPDTVRDKLWAAIRVKGDFDRRFKRASAAERYERRVNDHMKRRWIDEE